MLECRGLILQRRADVEVGIALAAPMANPLVPGVDLDQIDQPVLFLLAQEDNSIGEIGNQVIRNNAEELGATVLEVPDAGHWSFSDITGIREAFLPGCGTGTRQVGGDTFTYLDLAEGRDIAATAVAEFLSLER